jgi:hypothetical protein
VSRVGILASPYPPKMCEDMERRESRGWVTSVPRREFNQNPNDVHFLPTILFRNNSHIQKEKISIRKKIKIPTAIVQSKRIYISTSTRTRSVFGTKVILQLLLRLTVHTQTSKG